MAWMVLSMAVLTLIPFLGLNEFSTKGEPREAVVAMSMLQQHNWILPVNNGFDIPYKPPSSTGVLPLYRCCRAM